MNHFNKVAQAEAERSRKYHEFAMAVAELATKLKDAGGNWDSRQYLWKRASFAEGLAADKAKSSIDHGGEVKHEPAGLYWSAAQMSLNADDLNMADIYAARGLECDPTEQWKENLETVKRDATQARQLFIEMANEVDRLWREATEGND